MRGNQLGHGLVVFFRELVLCPRVQLQIKRPQFAHEVVVELDHFRCRHPVAGDLQRKVVRVIQLLRDAVAQITEFDQTGFEGLAGFLRRFPDRLALGEVGARLEQVVDFVYGDWFPVQLEFETVQGGCLGCLGGDAGGHEIWIAHRSFGGV